MSDKKYRIGDCSDCPDFKDETMKDAGERRYYCDSDNVGKASTLLVLSIEEHAIPIIGIPTWCPLKDYDCDPDMYLVSLSDELSREEEPAIEKDCRDSSTNKG